MLYSLSIKNVALIDNITVCFSDGFNVITGETGAGKSIMVDSLSLLLGDRTDRELVRTGTSAAEIEGVFSVRDKNAARVAEALDIEPDDTYITLIYDRLGEHVEVEIPLPGREAQP